MKISIYLNDIFSQSKIQSVIQKIKGTSFFSDDIEKIKEHEKTSELIFIDIMMPGAFVLIEEFPKKCICFGPHLQIALFEKARALGCENVFPRSFFFTNIEKLINKKKKGKL